MRKALVLLLGLFAAGPAAAESSLPPVVLTMTSGAVTAHFSGENVGEDITDLRFVDNIKLWFTFDGDQQTYAAALGGQPHFGGWDFNNNIFSPDGRHVVLLHDHGGPYHVVALERLKQYLKGASKPDFEIPSVLPGHTNAGDFSNAKWTSSTSVEFDFACCQGEEQWRFEMNRNTLKCVREREIGGTWKEC